MKKSLIILLIISFVIMLLPPMIVDLSDGKKKSNLDTVQVNQLMEELEQSDGLVVSKESGNFDFDYTIIDNNEKVLYSSIAKEDESIVAATKRRDTIRDITRDGETVGWLIIHNRIEEMEEDVNRYYAKMYLVSYIAIIVLWVGYSIWFYVNIIRPFAKMKDFAGEVAAGNLDAPLEIQDKPGAEALRPGVLRPRAVQTRARGPAADPENAGEASGGDGPGPGRALCRPVSGSERSALHRVGAGRPGGGTHPAGGARLGHRTTVS